MMIKKYDSFIFKSFSFFKLNYFFFNPLFIFYNNSDIKKFIFSNFVLYFNFPSFFSKNLGSFNLNSRFFFRFILTSVRRIFFRLRKQNLFFSKFSFNKNEKLLLKEKRLNFSLNPKFFYLRYMPFSFIRFFVFKFFIYSLQFNCFFVDKSCIKLNFSSKNLKSLR
jgi:hypothetical protein